MNHNNPSLYQTVEICSQVCCGKGINSKFVIIGINNSIKAYNVEPTCKMPPTIPQTVLDTK